MEKQRMNYNDLRVLKTEKLIRGALHELAQEKPISKITVKELVKRAEINKTTFYAHYDTIQDLIDTLEQETIVYIVDNMGSVTRLLEEPERFIDDLYHALADCRINSISHINPNHTDFTRRLNQSIHQALEEKEVDVRQHQQMRILIPFIVSGLLGLLRNPSSTEEADLAFIKKFVRNGLG